jgi:type II secretory pathway pseudopilin PulG
MEGRKRARAYNGGSSASARPRVGDGSRSQRGELLIETLITISLVGLGVVAIVAALGTVIGWANQDRSTTKTEALLWSYSEALSQVPYEKCAAGGATPYAAVAVSALPAALPDGTAAVKPGAGDGTDKTVVLTISAVAYWDTKTVPASFVPTCPVSDPGAQALTLTATSGDGTVTRTLAIYKRTA